MRRTLVTIIVLGLLAGSLATVAEAKKKPKKKAVASEQKFFLHWDSDGATPPGCAGAVYMSLEDKSGDSTCSTTTQFAQEAFVATGSDGDIVRYLFPAADGVPFTLDASRNLKGAVILRGTYTYDAYVEILLTGEVDGAPVKLAEGATGKGQGVASNSVQGTVQLPGPHAELPIDIAFDKAFDKKLVTKLDLQITIRGHHRGGVDYELNPSHVIVPTWK